MVSWRFRNAVLSAGLVLASFCVKDCPLSAQTAKAKAPVSPAQDLFRQADKLLRQGAAAEAQAKVEEGLKLEPRSEEGYDLLGLIYQQEKEYGLSTQAFEKALMINPRSTEALNNLGNVFLLEQKLDAAERDFRAALALDPQNRSANYNLGVVLLTQRRSAEAIRYFQRVHPADMTTRFNLVQAYLQAGQTQKGLEAARRLSDEAKNDVRLHFTLGVALAANKQYGPAERELEAADALKPGTFEILFNLGQTYLQTGQTAKAEDALGRALKLEPDSVETMCLLGQAYFNERKDSAALDLLLKAHQLAPQNTDAIFLLARISMKQYYYEDAIPLLESGVKIAPNRPDLHAALGECYTYAGKTDKAIQEFQALIKLDPSAPSYDFMALCYRQMGRFDEAKKYLAEGLKSDPRNAACLYNMGYIASRQGNYSEAEKWLEKALQVSPDYPDALRELAGAKMDEKKFQEAVPLLRKCAQLDPNPAPDYYKLATAERNLHQMAAAERDLKVFQTLSKNLQAGPYPYQHLFDYLDTRAGLSPSQQSQVDLAQLQQEIATHPEHPDTFYLLAETYLKLGRRQEAEDAIQKLDQLSQGDFRTDMGIGVLLARYRLYPQAIAYFQKALKTNPSSDEGWYDLADAYFRARDYPNALAAIQRVSEAGQSDPSTLSLLGDIDSHLGRADDAVRAFNQVIAESPDKDQSYLSLALTYLRSGDFAQSRKALQEGLARTPDSGELFWGMGVLSVAQGNTGPAEQYFRKAVDLLPEWPGSYSALGVFYYQTGQIEKAKETLKKFTENGPQGGLDVQRIQQALAAAPTGNAKKVSVLSPQAREQFLQIAFVLADETP